MANIAAILWTFIALVGVTIGVIDLLETYSTYRRGGGRRPLAKRLALYYLRRSSFRTAAMALFFLIGVIVLFLPEAARGITAWILLAGVTIIVVNMVLERFERLLLDATNVAKEEVIATALEAGEIPAVLHEGQVVSVKIERREEADDGNGHTTDPRST